MQHKYNKFILQYLPLLAKIEALFIFLTLLDTFLADSDGRRILYTAFQIYLRRNRAIFIIKCDNQLSIYTQNTDL